MEEIIKMLKRELQMAETLCDHIKREPQKFQQKDKEFWDNRKIMLLDLLEKAENQK